jgi:hypothetical protein
MAKFTNHGVGPRGINLKDRTTRYVEPGETVEIDQADIAEKNGVHADFKAPPKAEKDADDDKKQAATAKPEPKA